MVNPGGRARSQGRCSDVASLCSGRDCPPEGAPVPASSPALGVAPLSNLCLFAGHLSCLSVAL